ncbi:carbohydrate-binding module family 13 protein [Hypholoma sublateritium FD-334 SS-4]|uniref:Carbohydrate-binding module family 13 protein n=1 Tax=Hypholoma sublateritium (strain FD-334 SS-4) TaxID=945553 RepID=A0A0D2M528_HYPSF|nr:carbohydrate-binding module family 13 protein [Hypholoma sublateritium FD-334 SS-4]
MNTSPLLPSIIIGLLFFPSILAQINRQYVVSNLCPSPINIFLAGEVVANLNHGDRLVQTDNVDASYWYTDANGGRYTGVGTTRAGFWLNNYELVKDAGQINTGMKVFPENPPTLANGTCAAAECENSNCTDAFIFPPPSFPLVGPNSPPLHFCGPAANITFDIQFCPTGVFPPNSGIEIHPLNTTKCVDVRGAQFANGTPVQIYDCNGTNAQKWFVVRGSTKVQLAGTNFCLDAGSSPANGVGLKIWQCFDNLPAQQWFFTNDSRIALENQGQCMDLTNGVQTNGNQLQTWKCTDADANQVWDV